MLSPAWLQHLACSLTGVAIEMLLHVSGLEKAPIECSLSREKQEATVTQEKTTLKTKEVWCMLFFHTCVSV